MDETAVRFYMPQRKGLVPKRRRGGPSRAQDASRRQQRSCATHVAAICDDTAVQPSLPQVFIGNEAVLQAAAVRLVQPALHKNAILLRRKSGWVNKDFLVSYVKLLAACLEPFASDYQPILLWDALPAHCAPSVLRAAGRAGLWVVIVPAKMTWLLQPLDTHVFLRYKAYLRTAYQLARIAAVDGQLSIAQFLQVLYETIRKVLQGHRWARAFDENGLGQVGGESLQPLLSGYIRRHLQLSAPPTSPAAAPPEDMLKLCYPRNAKVLSRLLLRPYQSLAQPALPAPMAAGRLALPVGRPLGPHRGRGRGAAHLPGAPAAAAAAAGAAAGAAGPQTRSQSRLVAALARGRPLPRPP